MCRAISLFSAQNALTSLQRRPCSARVCVGGAVSHPRGALEQTSSPAVGAGLQDKEGGRHVAAVCVVVLVNHRADGGVCVCRDGVVVLRRGSRGASTCVERGGLQLQFAGGP